MGVGLKFYEQFIEAPDDKSRAWILAEAFDAIKHRYPEIKDLATGAVLRESELKLTKEIEVVRKETKETELKIIEQVEASRQGTKDIELKLTREIKGTELRFTREIKDMELKLTKAIKDVEKEIETVRKEIKDTEARLHQSIVNQTRWFLGGLAMLGAIFKLVDVFVG
uniref:DUF1640 domain-containing protein n=1 Tax=Candidatus Kentrum sp. TC TaxID=2126339 RepID=A0A450YE55_9GAMM|nr:MAG: hypothetical protein BECKTC1821D_GA0114238_100716 [Candidatus Kentron sp. TC]VFK57165.1 MAG: hypothetical protein BECKTC1821F_GA0114240_101516 [Candidatus Kentron sp. TC]